MECLDTRAYYDIEVVPCLMDPWSNCTEDTDHMIFSWICKVDRLTDSSVNMTEGWTSIDRIPRVIISIIQLVIWIIGRMTRLYFKGNWHVNAFDSVIGPRGQDNLLSTEVDSKNMNNRFHVVSPISENTSETFRGRRGTSCSIILPFIDSSDGMPLIKNNLDQYASWIRILGTIFQNVTNALLWVNDFQRVMKPKMSQEQEIVKHDVCLLCIMGKRKVMSQDSGVFSNVLRVTEPIFQIWQLTTFGMMMDLIWLDQSPKIRHHALVTKKKRIFRMSDTDYWLTSWMSWASRKVQTRI